MLTPRLRMIVRHINSKKIADIGTDHAYIPIYLLKNSLIEKAIATDLKPGPLKIAEENAIKYRVEDKIELRLGAGLSPIKEKEVECVIIAGMGGELISSILNNNISKARSFKYLVLQPMNSQDVLRKWLADNNFSVVLEDIAIEDFKVYNLIVAKSGENTSYKNEFELHLPPYLYTHEHFDKLKEKKTREFKKIKSGLEKADTPNIPLIKKYSDFLSELERI